MKGGDGEKREGLRVRQRNTKWLVAGVALFGVVKRAAVGYTPSGIVNVMVVFRISR